MWVESDSDVYLDPSLIKETGGLLFNDVAS